MSSPTLSSLRQTLTSLRQRRQSLVRLQQLSFAVIAVTLFVLAMTFVVSWLAPSRSGTFGLFAITVIAVLGIIGFAYRRLHRVQSDDKHLAHYVEERIPDLEQRLLTSLEFSDKDVLEGKKGVSQQFIEQLWQDAQSHVKEQQQQLATLTPARTPWIAFASALSSVALVTLVFISSDALLEAGNRLLWPFAIEDPVVEIAAPQTPALPIEITVEPGDLELQRGDSVTIIATVANAIPSSINLRLQQDNVNWRDVSMSRDGSGSDSASYSYYIPSLQEDTVYYVNFSEGEEYASQQFRIQLFDLPQVEQIDLAFDYPDYTAIEDITEEDSGDMVVPEGTEVELTVIFNKNIANATMEFDAGYSADDEEPETLPAYENVELDISANIGTARFTVQQDAVYRINAVDFDELVSKDPLDYFIRAIEDTPPELELVRPGRDEEVMPLEEVVLAVDAQDDYGLSEFTLNYSVIGTHEVAVDFLQQTTSRQVQGSELLYLEELGVQPGDFVSYFMTVADNNGLEGPNEVISDIYFLQVVPTDQEFRRNNGGGGGGGGGGQQGGDSSALVSIQKDVIAATWKLKNRQSKTSAEALSSDAEIIAESQREATERARMSIDRLSERLSFSDDSYDSAVENLSLAIDQMNLAAIELDQEQVTSALQPEQLALQYILRAEANINRTNVSMEQGGGGGGGGSAQQEREDLRELFEMELGQLENRYETPNSGGRSQQNQEEINKLEELARRQEGLTKAQRNLARREDQMTEEQKRRELERLMREQEQLSREVAQLSQQLSRQQQSQSSQQSSQQQSPQSSQQASQQNSQSNPSQSNSSSGGQSSSQQPQTPLERAAQQMQEASQSDSAAIAAARSQKALENLRQQQQQLTEQSERSVNQLAQTLSQRGQQLLQQQRQLQEALEDASRQQGLGQTRQAAAADEGLQGLIEQQQQQQRSLDEIEEMLRAVIARGDNDDQRLLSQAQQASRELKPIRSEMQSSNRVLRNGMINLSVDIEQELQEQVEGLAQTLSRLDPSRADQAGSEAQLAAQSAENLRQQLEDLEQQAQAFNEAGQRPGDGVPSLREMRQQLEQSQQLAQQLTQQLQQQQRNSRPQGQQLSQRGSQQQNAQQDRQQGGQQQGSQSGQQQSENGQQGSQGSQQASGQTGQPGQQGQAGGDANTQTVGSGQIDTSGNNSAYGDARAIRQELTQQDIEDFLNQPDLFRQLLQPITELEGALRAQAELENIENKLFAAADEDIPDQYKGLVEQYYRQLSESQGER